MISKHIICRVQSSGFNLEIPTDYISEKVSK